MNTFSYNPLQKIRVLFVNGLIMLLTIFMFQACGDDNDGPTDPPSETGNIAEVASSSDDFSDLVSALQDADLVSTLEGDGPFTVFAPTNEAFANLDVDISQLTNDQLVEILSYHVVSGEIASGDLSAEQSVEALAGGDLFVTVANGDVSVNDNATVVDADIEASNGVVHAIDQVLLPDTYQTVVGIVSKRYGLQSLEDAVVSAELASTLSGEGPFTVFAPNVDIPAGELTQEELQDVLTYHVLPSEVLSGDLDPAQTVETVQGQELLIEVADGTVTITDNSGQSYEVVEADLQGSNGVVHIIDGVLNPNPNIVDVASSADNFTALVDALIQTGLDEALQGAGPFTVFAPNDQAFAAVDLSGRTAEELTEILQYHVVSGNIVSGDLTPPQAVQSLSEDSLFITADGDIFVNDTGTVVNADIGASNGTIHEISSVLLPDAYQNIVDIVSKRYNLQTLEAAVIQAELASTLSGDGPFTVFAPINAAFDGIDIGSLTQEQLQDILTYHVLPGEVLAGDISSGTQTTVNGATVDITVDGEGNVTLTDQAGNDVNVIRVDLQGTNGVVHLIDGVLMPGS